MTIVVRKDSDQRRSNGSHIDCLGRSDQPSFRRYLPEFLDYVVGMYSLTTGFYKPITDTALALSKTGLVLRAFERLCNSPVVR